jgi:hypothetical protein
MEDDKSEQSRDDSDGSFRCLTQPDDRGATRAAWQQALQRVRIDLLKPIPDENDSGH